MKKIISLLLAMLMVFSLATVAFAAEEDTINIDDDNIVNDGILGTITASGVGKGTEYSVYKMLNLTSTSKDGDKILYTYTVTEAWKPFFAREDIKAYFKVSDAGFVTWEKDINDQKAAADVAKLALAFAKDEKTKVNPTQTMTADADNATLTFKDLELGYYLIDSSMGALCGLTTTNRDAALTAKNKAPTLDKQVKEDSTEYWGSYNSADIGQIVDFRVTINVHAGAENYVLHDDVGEGFTFQHIVPEVEGETITRGITDIRHIIPGATKEGTENLGTKVPEENYTIVTKGITDGCAFHIVFTKEFCEHLGTNDKVVVYYNAMLNRDAEIAGNGNANTAWLTFGDQNQHKTAEDTTATYTYEIDLVKTNNDDVMLTGATFKIYNAASGGQEIKVVPMTKKDAEGKDVAVVTTEGYNVYRRARADEEESSEIVVVKGIAVIKGLDNGTYYLQEITPPDGYNKLDGRKDFTIADGNLKATFITNDGKKIYETGSGVHVVNQAGNKLPETGAMGTAMFITFGMFVMLGTGVLLVTKKRMSMIED